MVDVTRIWLPAAAVVPQERGPDYLGRVEGANWSDGLGFYRGFFATFRLLPGKSVWFHWPLPMPVQQEGRAMALLSVSLLWETLDGARLDWVTLHHGGMDRLELTPRLQAPLSTPVPFEPAPELRQWCPVSNRQLSEFALPSPLPLRFGVQLSFMVSASEDAHGNVRF